MTPRANKHKQTATPATEKKTCLLRRGGHVGAHGRPVVRLEGGVVAVLVVVLILQPGQQRVQHALAARAHAVVIVDPLSIGRCRGEGCWSKAGEQSTRFRVGADITWGARVAWAKQGKPRLASAQTKRSPPALCEGWQKCRDAPIGGPSTPADYIRPTRRMPAAFVCLPADTTPAGLAKKRPPGLIGYLPITSLATDVFRR